MNQADSIRTKHIDVRMNQRGIPLALINLVLSYGSWAGDVCKLDRKDLRKLKGEVEELRSTVLKALDKGGVAVVEAGGALVTTYAKPNARDLRK